MHTLTHTHTHNIYAHLHVHSHTCTLTYTHIRIYTHTCIHIYTHTQPPATHTESSGWEWSFTMKQHKDKSISILFIWSEVAIGHLRWMRFKWSSGTNLGHKWPKELSHGRVDDLCVDTKGSYREEGGLRTEGVHSMRQKMKKWQGRWIWWPQL